MAPTPLQDNAVAFHGGKVYSAFGCTGSADTNALYVYDPEAGTWSKKASAADARDPAHGFIDGKLYVVGGCTSTCGTSDATVYDPESDSWSAIAPCPETIAWESCGGIDGKLYCAGGTADSISTKHACVHDTDGDSWSPVADLPADLWGSAYSVGNGMLLVSGGVTGNGSSISPRPATTTPRATPRPWPGRPSRSTPSPDHHGEDQERSHRHGRLHAEEELAR